MNKYTALIATALLACNVAHAGDFYAGLNLGLNSVKVEKTLLYPIGGTSLTSQNYNPGYNGFHGQLFIGKGFTLSNNWNVNLQGDADLFNGSTKSGINNWFLGNNASTKEQLKSGIGLFVLPEYQWAQGFKVFAGPGWVYSKFSATSGSTAGNLGVTGSYNKWLSAWAVKVGTANRICNNVDFLMTYQFNQYNSLNATNVEPLSGSLLRGKYKPNANIFSVGLRYVAGGSVTPSYEK